MYEISLSQDEKTRILGILENKEDLSSFISCLEGVLPLKKDGPNFYLDPQSLEDYREFSFKGHVLSLTRFEFPSPDPIYLEIRDLENLSREGKGYVRGSTVIENYAIPNDALKTYIEEREGAYARVKAKLEDLGYRVTRALQASEDGEAIVLEGGPSDQWYYAALDPVFVRSLPKDDKDLDSFVRSFLDTEKKTES